jgi:hypothetical protein
MGLGAGIFLVAVGAVLAFALHVNDNGVVNIGIVGWILMGVGVFGIILSLVFWSSWAGPGWFTRRHDVIDPAGGTHTTIDQF